MAHVEDSEGHFHPWVMPLKLIQESKVCIVLGNSLAGSCDVVRNTASSRWP